MDEYQTGPEKPISEASEIRVTEIFNNLVAEFELLAEADHAYRPHGQDALIEELGRGETPTTLKIVQMNTVIEALCLLKEFPTCTDYSIHESGPEIDDFKSTHKLTDDMVHRIDDLVNSVLQNEYTSPDRNGDEKFQEDFEFTFGFSVNDMRNTLYPPSDKWIIKYDAVTLEYAINLYNDLKKDGDLIELVLLMSLQKDINTLEENELVVFIKQLESLIYACGIKFQGTKYNRIKKDMETEISQVNILHLNDTGAIIAIGNLIHDVGNGNYIDSMEKFDAELISHFGFSLSDIEKWVNPDDNIPSEIYRTHNGP